VVVLVALLLVPTVAWGQPAQSERPPVTITVFTPQAAPPDGLRARLSITDEDGTPYVGVRSNNLRVQIDGNPAPISTMHTVFADTANIGVVFVVDRSGSVGDGALQTMRQAMLSLTETFSPVDRVGLITFDGNVTVAAAPGTPLDQVRGEMRRLREGNDYTALFDAVQQGAEMLDSMNATRRALFVFSDGEDTRSTLSQSDVTETLDAVDWPVFAAGVGSSIQSQSLRQFASVTAGEYIERPSGRLSSFYRTLVAPLDGLQYVIQVPFTGERYQAMHRFRVETRYQGTNYAGTILFADRIVPPPRNGSSP
jgi:hypothetical protein